LRLPLCASIIPGLRFAHRPGWDFDVVRPEANAMRLGGVYLAEDGGERVDIQALINLLRKLNAKAEGRDQRSEVRGQKSEYAPRATLNASRILRAARNVVWSVSAPWNAERTIVIKAFKPRSVFRRLLDYGKPDKALRSWNGAQELLRRGLCSPTPLACLVPVQAGPQSAIRNPQSAILCATSYYICEAFAPAWSARDAFTAFSAGATEFQGIAANDWYAAIAVFMQKLHTRGVYFRDLSAGNLLARSASVACPPKRSGEGGSALPRTPAGELEFALIDTARARFYPYSLGLRLRLCDLMRICHPLDWPNRRIFVEQYLAHNGRRFSWWMKIPFWYYDGKHRVKNALKRR